MAQNWVNPISDFETCKLFEMWSTLPHVFQNYQIQHQDIKICQWNPKNDVLLENTLLYLVVSIESADKLKWKVYT